MLFVDTYEAERVNLSKKLPSLRHCYDTSWKQY